MAKGALSITLFYCMGKSFSQQELTAKWFRASFPPWKGSQCPFVELSD